MLTRLYVHNFRCLENFEFRPAQSPSALLIGKNGSGKSTLARVLKIFQSIGRGVNRVGQLVKPVDFALGRTTVPMRFELEVNLDGHPYQYILALELPERFRELRVVQEELHMDGRVVYSREQAQVALPRNAAARPDTLFTIDWHLVALPVIHDPTMADPLSNFRNWLARMMILAPIPRLMTGESTSESLEPSDDGSNFADWLSGLLALYPAAYSTISDHLKQVMPDLAEFRNAPAGKDAKSLTVCFESGQTIFNLGFDELSDGEKCFFLCAVVLAANKAYGPLLAFWDEPDNHLSLAEIGHFVLGLRRGFQGGGQIFMTSHSEETIRRFSSENTWVLGRKSHLEPTQIRQLEDMASTPDVIDTLIRGELEP